MDKQLWWRKVRQHLWHYLDDNQMIGKVVGMEEKPCGIEENALCTYYLAYVMKEDAVKRESIQEAQAYVEWRFAQLGS